MSSDRSLDGNEPALTFERIAEASREQLLELSDILGIRINGSTANRKILDRVAWEYLRRACVLKGVVD